MARNVHKQEVSVIKLPIEAIQEDRGLRSCATPQLVLASRSDAAYYKNDRTSLAFKFDSMTVELEDAEGNTIAAPGVSVTFPYQSDAVGFVIDWRQVEVDGVLTQGCWRVVVNWSLSGMTGSFYYGSYQLREYSVLTAAKTVRLFVVLNDIVKRQGINYKDSGFAGTVRFMGQFGYMQPNYETENIIYTNNTREKVRIEALRTYELRTNYLLHCMTRLVDEETLLAASQIYVTDHNANNHRQDFYDFPVIVSEDESPTFDYTDSIYAKITAKFKDKVADHESKYDGNIQGSDNIILSLPAIVNQTEPCPDTSLEVNGVSEGSVVAGSIVDVITNVVPASSSLVGSNLTLTFTKELFWELNFNDTDDVIFIPATVSNVGTLASGSGSNVGTIDVSTDGVTYGALSFPFTPVAATTYYFKRSTFTVTGAYTMTGTYA
jgi:hypothetical protein